MMKFNDEQEKELFDKLSNDVAEMETQRNEHQRVCNVLYEMMKNDHPEVLKIVAFHEPWHLNDAVWIYRDSRHDTILYMDGKDKREYAKSIIAAIVTN